MKLIKITPNGGRGTVPIFLNSDEILKIDFGANENADGCRITLKDKTEIMVFDSAKSIFNAVNV